MPNKKNRINQVDIKCMAENRFLIVKNGTF